MGCFRGCSHHNVRVQVRDCSLVDSCLSCRSCGDRVSRRMQGHGMKGPL